MKPELKKLFKNKNNLIIIIILIIGVILMLVPEAAKNKQDTEPAEAAAQDDSMERRLEAILADISGAGRVSVMITYDTTAQKLYASESLTEKTVEDGRTKEKTDQSIVMSDGSPAVEAEIYPSVRGVIVTADGGDDPSVREQIIRAVQAVTGAASHRICVYKKTS